MNIRRKHIRELTESLLEEHRVNAAPVPVEAIIRSKGASIVEGSVEERVSGFFYRQPGTQSAVIGVNKSHPPTRRRFTLAHELGHFLIHAGDGVHVDKEVIRLRDNRSSEGTNVEEIEANIFAAELLMPQHFLARDLVQYQGQDLSDTRVLQELAASYKVSVGAMTIRLTSLGYLGFV